MSLNNIQTERLGFAMSHEVDQIMNWAKDVALKVIRDEVAELRASFKVNESDPDDFRGVSDIPFIFEQAYARFNNVWYTPVLNPTITYLLMPTKGLFAKVVNRLIGSGALDIFVDEFHIHEEHFRCLVFLTTEGKYYDLSHLELRQYQLADIAPPGKEFILLVHDD